MYKILVLGSYFRGAGPVGLGILAEHVYTGYLVPLYACSQGSTGLSLRCTSQVLGLELDLNVQPTNLRGSHLLEVQIYHPHN